jgi:hypothetical protein
MSDGDTIGAPDGIHYEIVSTREETRPSVACGFNDIGMPNPAVFKIETRRYREYRAGVEARSWTEDVDEFVRCAPV